GALLLGKAPVAERSVRREKLRYERQRRDDADALPLQRARDRAQRRVVAEAAQPRQHLHAEPIGAQTEEARLAQSAAEHRLCATGSAEHLGDPPELPQLHPGEARNVLLQLRIRLALVRRRHHLAPGPRGGLGEEDREPTGAGDQSNGLHQRAIPRSDPSRKATKWSISGWPP